MQNYDSSLVSNPRRLLSLILRLAHTLFPSNKLYIGTKPFTRPTFIGSGGQLLEVDRLGIKLPHSKSGSRDKLPGDRGGRQERLQLM